MMLFVAEFSALGSGQNGQKTVWRSAFLGTQITVPYCQKYTPTDAFFSDFVHYVKAFNWKVK